MLSCRECCQTFGCSNPFVYFCYQCSDFVHQHSARKAHKTNKLAKLKKTQNVNTGMETLELFAVVCIKTSHYVTFAKCGETPNDRWVFFDSMADRVGRFAWEEKLIYIISMFVLCLVPHCKAFSWTEYCNLHRLLPVKLPNITLIFF